MSEDRSSLTIVPPEANLVSGLPPFEAANPLLPPKVTQGVPSSLVNPLAPVRSMVVTPQVVRARDVPISQRWGLATPSLTSSVDWNDEQLQLRQRVSQMWGDMPPQYRDQVRIESGFRTHEQQAELWQKHLRGEIGKTAQPGSSLHEQGLAADWHFDSPQAKAWMYNNAGKYGLAFPFSDDDGHMQTIERTDSLSPEAKAGAILPKIPAQYRQPVLDAAYANGIEPRLLASVIQQESSFNPKSGPQIGLGQLTADTAKDLGVNPYDVNDNLMGSARRLRQMFDDPRVQGDTRKALMLYNSGPGGSFNNPQYADAVMGHYNEFAPDSTYAQAPGGYKSGLPGVPATHALSLPYGPQGTDQTSTQTLDQTPIVTPSNAFSQAPGLLGSPGLLALAMGMATGRFKPAAVNYDPWAVEQRGEASMQAPGSMGLGGFSIPRVGSKVPGSA